MRIGHSLLKSFWSRLYHHLLDPRIPLLETNEQMSLKNVVIIRCLFDSFSSLPFLVHQEDQKENKIDNKLLHSHFVHLSQATISYTVDV